MATRGMTCFIKNIDLKTNILKEIEKNSYCMVYHHYDSYPEGVGEILREAIDYSQDRIKIDDVDYATMSIINFLVNKSRKDIKNGDLNGFGICTELYSDMEYLYIINMTTKTLKCYEIDFGDYEIGEPLFTYQFDLFMTK